MNQKVVMMMMKKKRKVICIKISKNVPQDFELRCPNDR
jgi:hypothetical protein